MTDIQAICGTILCISILVYFYKLATIGMQRDEPHKQILDEILNSLKNK